ncbi:MAG: DUF4836 family protein [Bacteroidetes bacterium]|nr:DUF4836 family protein [Bacteroidota bacterium]
MRKVVFIFILASLSLITACNKTPDHASYIPKDAAAVLSINTNAIGKKIAWDAIWGSKLLNDMQKNMSDSGLIKDLAKCGIKEMSTYYLYVKPDKRFQGSSKVAAVIPLADDAKWEAYIKKTNQDIVIKQVKDRKEACLSTGGMYISWTKDVLIAMNTIYQTNDLSMDDFSSDDPGMSDSMLLARMARGKAIDTALMAIEMDKAFTTSKDNAITADKHFMELQEKNHDISFWLNYETMMGEYMSSAMTGGIAMSPTLWKGAAAAAGIDFEKGSIKGNMLYYSSNEMNDIMKEFAGHNVNEKMLNRLPAEGLDLLAAWYFSPKAIKATIDKTGMAELINGQLAEKNLTIDYILDAFAGDMVLSLNNFSYQSKTVPANTDYPGQEEYSSSATDIDYTCAVKIGKKENLDRLIQLAIQMQLLKDMGAGSYSAGNTSIIIKNDELVFSNKADIANAYLDGKFASNAKNGMSNVKGHPFGLFFDVKTMLNGVDPSFASNADDHQKFNLTKNLVSDVVFNGGEYKNNAYESNISINFNNKDENSLLILLDYASKMNEKRQADQVALNK